MSKEIQIKRITLLVDGEYLLKRSFLSKSTHHTTEFGDMNGLFNFMLTLRTQVKNTNANKVVVCWDGENGGKMRYNLYEGYKANRKNKDWYNKIELSDAQIKFEENKDKSILLNKIRIQQYLEELFIRQIPGIDGIEGDDLIAYYTKEYHKDEIITIYSNDGDLRQMVELDRVSVYVPSKNATISSKNYFLYFKHHYSNLRVIKTFCGDDSDNIPGVHGLGETKLLTLFQKGIKEPFTIDYILEECEKLIKWRKENKKPALKVLDAILKGTVKLYDNKYEDRGKELYETNYKLVNLHEPFITKEAKHIVRETATSILSSEDRGSKNLIKYMEEDGFMKLWNGTVSSFCAPFYPTIIKEKGEV